MVPREQNRRRGGAFTGIIATLALLIALAALFLALFRDPLGRAQDVNWNAFGSSLVAYDLSTPTEAYKSNLKMQYKGDIRAAMELSRLLEHKDLKEQIDTLEIVKQIDLKLPEKGPTNIPLPTEKKETPKKEGKMRDLKVLFVTFKKDGEMVHKLQTMEKHSDSGLWKVAFVNSYQVEGTNKDLAKEMREWEEKDANK